MRLLQNFSLQHQNLSALSREFLLNLILLLVINLLVKPLYVFGVDLQVQNAVGGDAYGVYFALFNFSCLFQIVCDMGIQQYNTQAVARDSSFFYQHFIRLLRLKGGLALLYAGLVLVFAWGSGYTEADFNILYWLLLNQVFISLTFYFRSIISGLQQYRLDSLLSSMDKLLMLAIGAVLIYTPYFRPLSIQWFVMGQSLAFVLTALLAGGFCWYYYNNKPTTNESSNTYDISIQRLLKDGSSYAAVVILMTFYTRIDGVLLERLSPDGKEAGVYAFGFRLLDICNMVGYLFASLLLPMFARLLTQRDELRQLLTLATSLMAVFTLSAGAVVWALADDFTRLMLDNYEPASAMVLRWLFVGLQAVGMIHIWGTLLTARGNLWGVNRVFAVAIVINVGLNWYAIPQYGALGAAWVALITQSFVAIAEGVLVLRWLQIRPRGAWLLRWGGFVSGLMAAVWVVTNVCNDWHWYTRLLVLGAWCVVWAVGCGALPIVAMFKLLKHRTA